MAHPMVEVAFGVMALGFGVWAARTGMRHHAQKWPVALLAVGLTALAVRFVIHFGGDWQALLEPHAHHHPSSAELVLSVGGGVFLVLFHVANALLIRRMPHAHS